MTVYTQGSQLYSLEDTVLLLLDEVLDDDLSSEQINPTLASGGAYEDPSPTRALSGELGRELYVQATIDLTDMGAVLLWHGDPTDYDANTYVIELTSGTVAFKQGSSALFYSPTLTEQGYHIHWSTRPNPDTTGASDAVISEFMIVQASDYEVVCIEQVAHAVSATDTGWALAVGGWWDGTSLNGEPNYPVQVVRIGVAHHPNAEWYDSLVDARPSHTITLPNPPVLLPLTVASGVGNVGTWAGAANIGWSAAHANSVRGRMLSDLVNEVYSQPTSHTSAWTPTQRYSLAPDGSNYRLDIANLRWVEVPRGVSRVWVRLHVQSWVTGGASVPVDLRIYSFNRPFRGIGGALGGAPAPAFTYNVVQASINTDHGSGGVGEWVAFELLTLAIYSGESKPWKDSTLLAVGIVVDPASVSANDAAARLRIKAWHVRPVLED